MGVFSRCARGRNKLPLNAEVLVYANDHERNVQFRYPANGIRTTKYTLLTFVPKNLFEQFRRYQNLYFLIVAILTLVPSITPISPLSAVLPFLLIILTAAAKEAFEDIKRWQSDKEVNHRKYKALRGGQITQIHNEDITVGDILYLEENDEVPADCVLLSTNDDEGVCYVETANLDGETNLKLFRSCSKTQKITKAKEVAELDLLVRCEHPNAILYQFRGNLQFHPTKDMDGEGINMLRPKSKADLMENDDIEPLADKNLLMRGVRLRNTKFAYGLVVYAGKQSKLALNQVAPPSKFSRTEKRINIVTLLVFSFKIFCVCSATIAASVIAENTKSWWYNPLIGIDAQHSQSSWEAGTSFIGYFVLLSYFIPVSLFVNLEIIKLTQAGYMMGDDDMKIELNGSLKGMAVKNSNLNDELSRVSYVFSDKTGTLTANKMIFNQCAIDGVLYPEAGKGGLKKKVKKSNSVKEFFLHLTLNHQVLPEEIEGEDMPKYAAPTPDEIALVKGAFLNGVELLSRSNAGLTIRVKGKKLFFEVLDTLEFSSTRKRSSVIVRTPAGKIVLYCKGADDVILERLDKSVAASAASTLKTQLTDYSKEGLRTLVLGYKYLSDEEYKTFHRAYKSAASLIERREETMAKLMDDVEQDLLLQGCTAIVDKLQEQVPWAINYMIRAGIKVWMITGDKQETAENIGRSCKLVTDEMHVMRVVRSKDTSDCKKMLEGCLDERKSHEKVTLVIDGQSLVFALADHADLLLQVGQECETVICCRSDPLQKALVVRLMKGGTGKVCLSIGDGANDVSMLQEAHIGVGIWGEEGTQAARNSDYAIRLFRHLAKLLTVHGRYSMLRNGCMVEYSFYKNLAMFMCHIWYGFFCQFSAQTFLDDWMMALYNTLILSLPPLALAFWEKDLTEEQIGHHPEVYRELRGGLYFTARSYMRWVVSAAYHSLGMRKNKFSPSISLTGFLSRNVIFFTLWLMPDVLRPNGQDPGLWAVSTIVGTAGVWAIIMRGMIGTNRFVWPTHVANFVSFGAPLVLFAIESNWLSLFPNFYGVMNWVLATGNFWFVALWIVAACNIPEIAYEYLQRQYWPKDWQVVAEVKKFSKLDMVELSAEVYPLISVMIPFRAKKVEEK